MLRTRKQGSNSSSAKYWKLPHRACESAASHLISNCSWLHLALGMISLNTRLRYPTRGKAALAGCVSITYLAHLQIHLPFTFVQVSGAGSSRVSAHNYGSYHSCSEYFSLVWDLRKYLRLSSCDHRSMKLPTLFFYNFYRLLLEISFSLLVGLY